MKKSSLEFWKNALHESQIYYKENYTLKEHTSFRVGGSCNLYIRPSTAIECGIVQKLLQAFPIPFFYLGAGSNLLISDENFPGAIIHYQGGEEIEVLKKTDTEIMLQIPASARAPFSAKRICAMGYTGLEFLTTIPGSIGGAVIQNAGCYGQEIKDVIYEIQIVKNGEVIDLPAKKAQFSYRSSLFKQDNLTCITGIKIKLLQGDQTEINQRVDRYKAQRISSQPKNRRSAGSIYKNPAPDVSDKKAWELIDLCGLRGTRAGDAEISLEHCNFIVNRKKATAQDIYSLMQKIEKQVKAHFGIELEREVVLLGKFGREKYFI